MKKSHREILEMWPSMDVVALDAGVQPGIARMWRFRSSIPANRWTALVSAAQDRDIPLTYKMLAEAAAAS